MGKTLGEMSPEERREVTDRALRQLQRELTAAAPAIGRVLDEEDRAVAVRTKPASELTLAEIRGCEGIGRKWMPGMGRAICPVCHAGPGTLKVKAPRRYKGTFSGQVPPHPNMVIFSGLADPEAWRAVHPEYKLTPAQLAAYNQMLRRGSSALGKYTDVDLNTVHTGSARVLVKVGLAERFHGPDGPWVKVKAVAQS